MAIDEQALDTFMDQYVRDAGAVFHAATVLIGDRLGLYRALADGACTSTELAERTGTAERYVREWLRAQAASGFVCYDATTDRYHLDEVQAFALADEDSPALVLGGFQLAAALIKDEPLVTEAFRTGRGVGWHEHNPEVFEGCERLFRPGYIANLVGAWIPALDDVEAKLHSGARVADVGCGHGASTVLMAQAYPSSIFVGFDYHEPSLDRARKAAAAAGVADHCTFEAARSSDYPGSGYDLVTSFDCLHDLGDPVGAAAHVLETLDADGTWMIVEPFAHDHLVENLNPIGRICYSASTLACVPTSLSQEIGLALGNQAGETTTREVVTAGGFTRFRRAAEAPFNIVYEARP